MTTEDEDIVDAERVFDQVTGKEIDRLIGSLPPPDDGVEAQRERDPEKSAPGRAPHADSLLGTVAEEIDGQCDEDSEVKSDPKPDTDRHGALAFHV